MFDLLRMRHPQPLYRLSPLKVDVFSSAEALYSLERMQKIDIHTILSGADLLPALLREDCVQSLRFPVHRACAHHRRVASDLEIRIVAAGFSTRATDLDVTIAFAADTHPIFTCSSSSTPGCATPCRAGFLTAAVTKKVVRIAATVLSSAAAFHWDKNAP